MGGGGKTTLIKESTTRGIINNYLVCWIYDPSIIIQIRRDYSRNFQIFLIKSTPEALGQRTYETLDVLSIRICSSLYLNI